MQVRTTFGAAALLVAAALAGGCGETMKDDKMKGGMKDDKMKADGMMKDDKGMMKDDKGMMKDDKGMMKDDKGMMKDDKGMMKDDKMKGEKK